MLHNISPKAGPLCLLLTSIQLAVGSCLTIALPKEGGLTIPGHIFPQLRPRGEVPHQSAAPLPPPLPRRPHHQLQHEPGTSQQPQLTNAQATASLTHLVKMTEPLCTVAIAVAMGHTRPTLALVVVLVAAMVTAIGSEPGPLEAASLAGMGLALLSNLFYAARNTGVKLVFNTQLTVQDFGWLSAGRNLISKNIIDVIDPSFSCFFFNFLKLSFLIWCLFKALLFKRYHEKS